MFARRIHVEITVSASVRNCSSGRHSAEGRKDFSFFCSNRLSDFSVQNLELLDRWEDILDLGVHCLALPIVDLPYAMMIVYAHLFKCLEPILVLVSILMIPEPGPSRRVRSKRRFSAPFRLTSRFSFRFSSKFVRRIEILRREQKKVRREQKFGSFRSLSNFRREFSARVDRIGENLLFRSSFGRKARRK